MQEIVEIGRATQDELRDDLRERLHGEIKRRIKAAGAFPDRASALRLITAVALRTTHVWGDRRYLDLSRLQKQEVAQAA